ncbi:SdrD B-like domain-containing protein, partial [Aerococcus vaginalis]
MLGSDDPAVKEWLGQIGVENFDTLDLNQEAKDALVAYATSDKKIPFANFAAQTREVGQNVNDNVHMDNIDLIIVDNRTGQEKTDIYSDGTENLGKDTYQRFGADSLTIRADFTVDDSVKAGDYFEIDLGDSLYLGTPYTETKDLNIMFADGTHLAEGTYEGYPSTNNVIKMVFTDAVDRYQNIHGNFSFGVGAKEETITEQDTLYPFSFSLAGEEHSEQLKVNYWLAEEAKGNPNSGIAPLRFLSQDGKFQVVSYLNATGEDFQFGQDENGKNLAPRLTFYDKIGDLNVEDLTYRVFKVDRGVLNLNGNKLSKYSDGMFIDVNNLPSGLEEITDEVSEVDNPNPNQKTIRLGNDQTSVLNKGKNLMADGQQLIIVWEMPGEPGGMKDYVTMYEQPGISYTLDRGLTYYPNVQSSYSEGDNTVATPINPDTEEETFKIGDYIWIDDGDGVQGGESDKPFPNVRVTLTDQEGNVQETTTDDEGKYEFTDLSKGYYTINFETPDGYRSTTIGSGDRENDSNGTQLILYLDHEDLSFDTGFVKEEVAPIYNYEMTVEDEAYDIEITENKDLEPNSIKLVQSGEDGRIRYIYKYDSSKDYPKREDGQSEAEYFKEYFTEVDSHIEKPIRPAIIGYNFDKAVQDIENNGDGTVTVIFQDGDTKVMELPKPEAPKGDTIEVDRTNEENGEYVIIIKGPDGEVKETIPVKNGADGNSFLVETNKVDEGTTEVIFFYDKDGDGKYTEGIDQLIDHDYIRDGQNGNDGEDGDDGRTPSVTTERDEEAKTTTITFYFDVDGDGKYTEGVDELIREEIVRDGQNGNDGEDGDDGRTPSVTTERDEEA